jgi:hypothetical protein
MFYTDSVKDESRLVLVTSTSERSPSQDLLSHLAALYHHPHHQPSPLSQRQLPGHLPPQDPRWTLSPHILPSTHHQEKTARTWLSSGSVIARCVMCWRRPRTAHLCKDAGVMATSGPLQVCPVATQIPVHSPTVSQQRTPSASSTSLARRSRRRHTHRQAHPPARPLHTLHQTRIPSSEREPSAAPLTGTTSRSPPPSSAAPECPRLHLDVG